MSTIIIIGIIIFIIFLVLKSLSNGKSNQTTNKEYDDALKMTVTLTSPEQSKEEREKYEEDVRRSTYGRKFQEKHETLLKVVFYIVRADSTFNKQEKVIVKELFEKLEENNKYLTDEFLEYVYRKHKVTSVQAFKLNVNKILKSDEYDIDLLDFAKKIIDTQKTIHPSEQEILDYLEKKSREDKQ